MRQPNALAYTVSAEVLAKQGRYAEAFTEIGRAMALAPNNPDNYLSKARVLNATGRAAEAEESVRWAMRLDPLYSPEYLRVLAISLFHQQRYEEAVGTVERLVALKTDARGRLHHTDCEPWTSWTSQWHPRGYQDTQSN